MTREEENRKLAEWVGTLPHCSFSQCDGHPPDFYRDEAANALLLEKMPYAKLLCGESVHIEGREWTCWPDWTRHQYGAYGISHSDRKTAIASAALKLIESEAALQRIEQEK